MATVIVPRQGLTKEMMQEICTRAFAGRYEVYETMLIGADFVIKKSDWTGVSVKVKPHPNGTKLVFGAFAPAFWVRLFVMGLIPLLILYFGPWSEMTKENPGLLLPDARAQRRAGSSGGAPRPVAPLRARSRAGSHPACELQAKRTHA